MGNPIGKNESIRYRVGIFCANTSVSTAASSVVSFISWLLLRNPLTGWVALGAGILFIISTIVSAVLLTGEEYDSWLDEQEEG